MSADLDDETYRALMDQEEGVFEQDSGEETEWNVVQKKKPEKPKDTNKVTVESSRTTLAVPCRFFRLGKCAAGKSCRFSHEKEAASGIGNGLAPSPVTSSVAASTSSPPASSPAGSVVPCRYHLSGYCRNGPKCPFMHASRKAVAAMNASTASPPPVAKSVVPPTTTAAGGNVTSSHNNTSNNNTNNNNTTNNNTANNNTANNNTANNNTANNNTTNNNTTNINTINNNTNNNNNHNHNSNNNSNSNNYNNNSHTKPNGISHTTHATSSVAATSLSLNNNNINNHSNINNHHNINNHSNNNNNNSNNNSNINSINNLINLISPPTFSFNSNVANIPNSNYSNYSSSNSNNSNGFGNTLNGFLSTSMNGFISNNNNGFPTATSPITPRSQPSLLQAALLGGEKDPLSSVMSLWPASPPKFAASSLPAVSPFLPTSSRAMSSSLPSVGIPISSSPSFLQSSLSSSPFTMFAPTNDLEEEEEDDDDDDLLPAQPIGLTIIDDTPDDYVFNPFEDLVFGNNIVDQLIEPQAHHGKANGSAIPVAQSPPPQLPQQPRSYADIAKSNIPRSEAPAPPMTTIIFDEERDPEPELDEEGNNHLCQFYLQGICRYGVTCRNIHGDICESCQKPCLLPDNPQQNEDHIAACMIRSKMLQEREESKEVECGICYEKTVEKGRRFGLLSHCEHPFCLECIREWRGGSGAPTSTLRSCPICRVTSYFIIPSEGFIVELDRKEEIIDQYRDKLSTITCKYFNKGKGTCKFGSSCMYSHTNPDGSVYVPPAPRKMQDAEGDVLIYNGLKLSMFLEDFP